MSEIKKLSTRIWVPGKPTKGKVLECVRNQIRSYFQFKFDSNQFMDPKFWEASEQDETSGNFVTVEYFLDAPSSQIVRNDESAAAVDEPLLARVFTKKEEKEQCQP